MATILGSLIATYGMQGTSWQPSPVRCSSLAVLHSATDAVPAPVIAGFTSGIAVIIAMGQIDNFFGTRGRGQCDCEDHLV
ncbi:MAG: SulP family inorganic anion transporter [Butyricicoccus sp.]